MKTRIKTSNEQCWFSKKHFEFKKSLLADLKLYLRKSFCKLLFRFCERFFFLFNKLRPAFWKIWRNIFVIHNINFHVSKFVSQFSKLQSALHDNAGIVISTSGKFSLINVFSWNNYFKVLQYTFFWTPLITKSPSITQVLNGLFNFYLSSFLFRLNLLVLDRCNI